MDLPSVTNAPREVVLAGATYRARALTLDQLGEVLAWIDDRLPDDPARDRPTPISSEAARVALATTEGLAVLLHLGLASCHPAIGRDEARALAAGLDQAGQARLLSVVFRRRPQRRRDGAGKDIAEIDWGKVWENLAAHRADRYTAVGGLTLDQVDNFMAGGEADDEGTLTPAEVQAMWDAAPGPDPAPEPARDDDNRIA